MVPELWVALRGGRGSQDPSRTRFPCPSKGERGGMRKSQRTRAGRTRGHCPGTRNTPAGTTRSRSRRGHGTPRRAQHALTLRPHPRSFRNRTMRSNGSTDLHPTPLTTRAVCGWEEEEHRGALGKPPTMGHTRKSNPPARGSRPERHKAKCVHLRQKGSGHAAPGCAPRRSSRPHAAWLPAGAFCLPEF